MSQVNRCPALQDHLGGRAGELNPRAVSQRNAAIRFNVFRLAVGGRDDPVLSGQIFESPNAGVRGMLHDLGHRLGELIILLLVEMMREEPSAVREHDLGLGQLQSDRQTRCLLAGGTRLVRGRCGLVEVLFAAQTARKEAVVHP